MSVLPLRYRDRVVKNDSFAYRMARLEKEVSEAKQALMLDAPKKEKLKELGEGIFEMFLSTDDIVALHSQISELHRAIVHQERVLAELQRLGEPTALAEKFLARLQAQLAQRQQHLDSLTNNAANENI